ncbi:amino acid ABC transporter membrane protein 1, PAAT family [Rhizobiales bacterium GAS191]|jgi:polar amino acid transport system permease protein|nr:amino acid ABC transporter membrane protein 1, PAAT family [Rhizobiales bacterium GAS113]SEC93456.1 amino acid ABC transporter membrane protein 1, PAAT family [Rhizobiales bacterium GAS191]
MSSFDLTAVLLKPEFRGMLVDGFEMTLIVALSSWLLAMSLAIVLLMIRLTSSRIAEGAVAAYVTYHRNVPTLVQLILWYFGISSLLPGAVQAWLGQHNAEATFAIIGLGLCQAAYFSEDLRSGLRSIPPGQADAARALGHGYISAMRFVLVPQALRNALPALINHTVSLFKNSSLSMAIGVSELTYAAKEVENESFRTFETYLIATLVYLACSLTLMALGARLSRRAELAGAR